MLELVKGGRYRVVHKSETQKLKRESVLVLLGEEAGAYVFSARPVYGTLVMPKEWVLSIDPVDEMTEVYFGRVGTGHRASRRDDRSLFQQNHEDEVKK